MSNQKNWKVLDGCIVTDEADPQMVLVPSFSDHQYKPEDLQLMASAPKLLATLKAFVSTAGQLPFIDRWRFDEVCRAAQGVIAEATTTQ